MDEDISERLKALKRDLREMQEEVEALRKRKANGADVEQIADKLSNLETEMRSKMATLQSGNQEIHHAVKSLIEAIDALRADLNHHKRDTAEELAAKSKNSVWERIPPWAFLLMGVGLLALLQLGPQLWLDVKNLAP